MGLLSWQIQYKCRQCGDVIWSKRSGEFVRCKCGAIYCDQTPYYQRYGGQAEDFEVVNEDSKD